MRIFCYCILITFASCFTLKAQTLEEAKEWYKQKKYAQAMPVFEKALALAPDDAPLNLWYGVCVIETGGNPAVAVPYLRVADQKSIPDAALYLGDFYAKNYQPTAALAEYGKYVKLKRNEKRALDLVAPRKAKVDELVRNVKRTEDIRIIDSLVVEKENFLSAYHLSARTGKVATFNEMFHIAQPDGPVAFMNGLGTRAFYSQLDENGISKLFSVDKEGAGFGNEKTLSADNFGLKGDQAYPYVMPDGTTLYFAAKDSSSMGGYDLFVTRYSADRGAYLLPERLNMPFNSPYNDYMLVIDEEKGVGWFATDRFQPEGKVCVYTFIPNKQVKTIDNPSVDYLASRAKINSINDSWKKDEDYSGLIALARQNPPEENPADKKPDFVFVINDHLIYHSLDDFRSGDARQAYLRMEEIRQSLTDKQRELQDRRTTYSQADAAARTGMTQEIILLEKEVETIESRLKEATLRVRNLENQTLGK